MAPIFAPHHHLISTPPRLPASAPPQSLPTPTTASYQSSALCLPCCLVLSRALPVLLHHPLVSQSSPPTLHHPTHYTLLPPSHSSLLSPLRVALRRGLARAQCRSHRIRPGMLPKGPCAPGAAELRAPCCRTNSVPALAARPPFTSRRLTYI